ncbi:uncharacterized protein JCM10292_003740 [Rhodotorula paludigena]|uniref:uncharacterized protein n=1 Tax=Rhodotorula paludigena TaxID=86838 RepID=UPI00316DDED9
MGPLKVSSPPEVWLDTEAQATAAKASGWRPHVGVLRPRFVAQLALGFLAIVGLVSSLWPAAPAYGIYPDLRPFDEKGLSLALYSELSQIDQRIFVFRPAEHPHVSARQPTDPVPWSTTSLLPPRGPTTGSRWTTSLRVGRKSSRFGRLVSGSRFYEPVLPTHAIDAFPRTIALAPGQGGVSGNLPAPERLMFGIVTTAARASRMSDLWTHWLVSRSVESAPPRCLILLSQEEKEEDVDKLRRVLRERQISCGIKRSSYERYEIRVLSMVQGMRGYADEIGARIDWFVINDDDTFWLDMRAVRRMLSTYSPAKQYLVGATTEAYNQLDYFGRMAFGGAGMLFSRGLFSAMESIWSECRELYESAYGGDEMLTSCAARAAGTDKRDIMTEERGLHQLDVLGDTTGVLQGGLPVLSMHHFLGGGWAHLHGYSTHLTDMEQIQRIRDAAAFLGGDNMFQRYVFGDGKWLVVLGYSVTYFEEPLKPANLASMEHTWYEDYRLAFADRRRIEERHDPSGGPAKQTFYIDVLSANTAVFSFLQADSWDESLTQAERVRIQLFWDGDSPGPDVEQPPLSLAGFHSRQIR